MAKLAVVSDIHVIDSVAEKCHGCAVGPHQVASKLYLPNNPCQEKLRLKEMSV
jgi:hypothetical protein